MKLLPHSLLTVLVASCSVYEQGVSTPPTPVPPAPKATSPTPPLVATTKPKTITIAPPEPVIAPPEPQLPRKSHQTKYREITTSGIKLSLLSFDSNEYHLTIADQQPGAKWVSARQACADFGGLAAINAGFFNADGSPLGLVRTNGQSTGHWNTSSSLASGVYQLNKGNSSLRRNRSANRQSTELVQTGPFLLEKGKLVSGLSTKRHAQRSIILWDGANHFAIAHTSSCTLGELAQALLKLPPSVPRETVLNLDGGRSCDLYIDAQIQEVNKGHWLKSNVRNYLILVRK